MNSLKKFKNTVPPTLVLLTVLTGLICFPTESAALTVQKKDSAYLWLLRECSQDVFRKTFEYPFVALLNEDLKKEYHQLQDLEQKKSYITYYWKKNNPNPLLEENEYLLNFIKRYYYVKKNFSTPKPPYFDDRGAYYLKYGKPTTRITQTPPPHEFDPEKFIRRSTDNLFWIVELRKKIHHYDFRPTNRRFYDADYEDKKYKSQIAARRYVIDTMTGLNKAVEYIKEANITDHDEIESLFNEVIAENN